MYPDFISRDDQSRIIADAKYKPAGNIGNRDYLQVLAYMFRFDAKTGFYIYPESGELEPEQKYLNKGSTYERNVKPRNNIFIVKQGMHIPAAEEYAEFYAQIKQSEVLLRSQIEEISFINKKQE